MKATALTVALMATTLTGAAAQPGRPRAEVTAAPAAPTTPGSRARLSITVRLPAHVHVQAHEPRDPSLIATVLTVEAPPGITVEGISYPAPTELVQAGRADTLLVLGPEFAIGVDVAIAPGAPAGDLAVAAVLRYQACDDRVCFAPARAPATWTLPVRP